LSTYLNAIDKPIFKVIAEAASALDIEVYVIGGYVRDYILKRGQAKDIDIVAVGDGITLAQKVAQLLPHRPKVQVFKTYGTAL